MDNVKCNENPPNLNQSEELLKKLLAIELDRLETAVRIEKERKIVFPETSIIIHDIEKLNEVINEKPTKPDDDNFLEDIL